MGGHNIGVFDDFVPCTLARVSVLEQNIILKMTNKSYYLNDLESVLTLSSSSLIPTYR